MAVNTKPTEEMAEEASKGLEWRKEYGRGGTLIGVARARDISNRVNLSERTIGRMVSYFARHEIDKQAEGFNEGEKGYPSNGRIAWALWGGDAGQVWAKAKQKQLQSQNMITIENKAAKVKLNDTVHKVSVDEVIEQIDKVYGMAAVEASYSFGDVVASADGAVDTLEIEIHSAGGSVFDGYRIYNAMKELSARGVQVTARINTMAASMASVIAMAADKIEIASNGRIMIHDASAGQHGNAGELRKTADMLDEISDEIAGIYAERTKKDKKYIREMMLAETWMKAEQAVELGFADEIFDKKSKLMNLLEKFKPSSALTEKVEALESTILDVENKYSELNVEFEARGLELQNAITELTEVKNAHIELTEKYEAVSNAIALKDAEIEELKQAKNTEIEDLKQALVDAENNSAAKASEILASVGHKILDVDASEGEDGILTRDKINKIKNVNERIEARKRNWNKLNK